ncbi:MAG: hypothetical protein QM742_12160 [Aquabacterium sp.]
MAHFPILIEQLGLVTSVGLDADAACAAFRARISNPCETRFKDPATGQWIMAHAVPLAGDRQGIARLAVMAAAAIRQALRDLPQAQWGRLPLLLCVAESERPGRLAGLDQELFYAIQRELNLTFADHSMVITRGRVGVAVALAQARALMAQKKCAQVLVAATDSLLTGATLQHHGRQGRLLGGINPNGFMPGEGAGALLVGTPRQAAGELTLTGLGFGVEPAPLNSGEPLRAEGLSQAIKAALADAQMQMHELDYRITDLSGEQYYFKEAALALSRTLRVLKDEFDVWHPAECMGETGAAVGTAMLAWAQAAGRKGYGKGSSILAHMSNDAGPRAAITLRYQEA